MQAQLIDIYEDNQNLIYSLSNSFQNYQNKEDLIQVGAIGLINAYNNYDESYGVKFSTYAYPYILGEMRKLAREDKGIKISREIAKINLKIEKASILLSQKLMREPSITEIANYLDLPEWMIVEAFKSNNAVQSLDEPIVSDGKDMSLYDTIANPEKYEIDELISLRDELNRLFPVQKELIELRYFKDKSQMETAQILGLSQVQVSRLEQRTIEQLKKRLNI